MFSDLIVKGGGGALVLMAKEAREAALSPPQEKKLTYRDIPTLDYKGRINENMYHLYPGLYNKIKTTKVGSSSA